ncbi:MAG: Lipid II flippase MurJ [Chlamydiales bacterium]|nr:Lipid II flippase MurJ [Chlamydiales bacterium]
MLIQDSTRTIAKSAKYFFSGTLISRSTGLIREVLMAAIFGTTPAIAAFWMAFRFAHLLRRIFGEGALHAAFVPHFESLRDKDRQLAARFFYDLSFGVTALLLLLTVFIEIILGSCLHFLDLEPNNIEVMRLTMIMLPALVFISLYALNTSLLNCEKSYFLPSVAPVCLNLLWILAIVLFLHQPMQKAIESLAMIIVFAFALQWMVTLPKVLRYLSDNLQKNWTASRFSVQEILRLLRPFALGIVGVTAMQINSALDTLFARAADPEGPAYLWYALRIQQLPLALFGLGLTGALLPPLARAIQKNDQNQYLHFLNFALKRTLILLLPMTAALFALGLSGINLVYGHGAFSQPATLQTTACLWAYGAALVPMTLVLIFASAFYAQKNYRIPTTLAVLTVLLNMGFNALFVYVFHLGAQSIAMATAFTAFINGGLLAYFLKKEQGMDLRGVVPLLFKVLIASLVSTIVALVLGFKLVHENTLPWILGQQMHVFPRQIGSQLIVFTVVGVSFAGAFLLLARLLRIREFFDLFFADSHIPDAEKI